ncbi:hypothetical protein A7K73_08905 [Candidatus Methylacidiphilum fumarolicum]|nr:hypothetical protein A7K73_08905 [Candidatus Methylacidiphilum fumarolicum]
MKPRINQRIKWREEETPFVYWLVSSTATDRLGIAEKRASHLSIFHCKRKTKTILFKLTQGLAEGSGTAAQSEES